MALIQLLVGFAIGIIVGSLFINNSNQDNE